MVYLKALLFGSIGLVVAVIVRVLIWFVPAVFRAFRGTQDSRFQVGAKLLHEPLFVVLAVTCVCLGVYLGRP